MFITDFFKHKIDSSVRHDNVPINGTKCDRSILQCTWCAHEISSSLRCCRLKDHPFAAGCMAYNIINNLSDHRPFDYDQSLKIEEYFFLFYLFFFLFVWPNTSTIPLQNVLYSPKISPRLNCIVHCAHRRAFNI